VKIKELMERYNLKTRQSLYNRINHLGLTLAKDERGAADATPEQLELLDQLNDHLALSGATMEGFSPFMSSAIAPIQSSLDTVKLSLDKRGENDIMLEFVELLTQKMQPARSPLWHHGELERAYEAGWLLTSKEVQQLIGVKPIGDVFDRGCWRFVRSGKIGVQTAWRVEKSSS
jgi:hypothetical protein